MTDKYFFSRSPPAIIRGRREVANPDAEGQETQTSTPGGVAVEPNQKTRNQQSKASENNSSTTGTAHHT